MKLEQLIPESTVTQEMKSSIKLETWKFKTKTLVSLTSVQILLLTTEVPSFSLHLICPISACYVSQICESVQAYCKN